MTSDQTKLPIEMQMLKILLEMSENLERIADALDKLEYDVAHGDVHFNE